MAGMVRDLRARVQSNQWAGLKVSKLIWEQLPTLNQWPTAYQRKHGDDSPVIRYVAKAIDLHSTVRIAGTKGMFRLYKDSQDIALPATVIAEGLTLEEAQAVAETLYLLGEI